MNEIGEWKVPQPLATAEVRTEDGTRILLRRHGNPTGPRLVLSHGNGLAIDLYYPFWALLIDRFDIVVYDFRNHGRNPAGNGSGHNVAIFASDNEYVFRGIARHFGPKPWIGVFHSLSAVTILNHEPLGGGAAALVLFDPPIYPRSGKPLDLDAQCQWLRGVILNRPARFARRSQFADDLRRQPIFRRLRPGMIELAAQALLRPEASGDGYELCCPPEHQARILEYLFAYTFEPEPCEVPCPVKVIGADPALPFSYLPSVDAAGITFWRYDFVPETTHYLQLENPGECAAVMVRFLEGQGLA